MILLRPQLLHCYRTSGSLTGIEQRMAPVHPLCLQVTFSESVSGLDPSDFILSNTGTVVGTIASVTGGPSVYTVTVNAISGNGTMRLDFVSNGSVIDVATNLPIPPLTQVVLELPTRLYCRNPLHMLPGLQPFGADNFSIKLTWVGGALRHNRYLIRAKGPVRRFKWNLCNSH